MDVRSLLLPFLTAPTPAGRKFDVFDGHLLRGHGFGDPPLRRLHVHAIRSFE
jgi:hypothetical protein